MISNKMYETHRAQNYTMAERTKYRKKMFMEQANRQREIVSRNWYDIGKGENHDSSDQGTDKGLSGRGQD
jgi:hypothetical protein